ncbi:hypothetical protein ACFLWM_00885 [Chloroflexota bacterium]
MRNKAKKFWLSGLVALLVVPLLGCGFIDRIINPPALNKQEAIAIVLVAGTSYIDDYLVDALGEEEAQAYAEIGTITPTGDWDAVYQGEGKWEIQGPVITESWGECLTTWTINEADSKLRLIGFDCD